MSLLIKFTPGLMVANPAIVAFGLNGTLLEIIATTSDPTSICNTVYDTLSEPKIWAGVAPVESPSEKLGPTKIQPPPVNRYNC